MVDLGELVGAAGERRVPRDAQVVLDVGRPARAAPSGRAPRPAARYAAVPAPRREPRGQADARDPMGRGSGDGVWQLSFLTGHRWPAHHETRELLDSVPV